jgi:hypothetical protein
MDSKVCPGGGLGEGGFSGRGGGVRVCVCGAGGVEEGLLASQQGGHRRLQLEREHGHVEGGGTNPGKQA